MLISSRKLDQMYRVQKAAATFLELHPKPYLVLVSSSSRPKRSYSAPLDKEGKKLDLLGRHFYPAGALDIKTSASLGQMGSSVCSVPVWLWEQPRPLLDAACKLQKEGMTLVEQQRTVASHTLDSCANTFTLATSPCRHSWLRASALQQDTKVLVEDLPFDGDGLFSFTNHSTLQEMDKSIKALHALGASS